MDAEFWEAVRQRAHVLWLEEGCPEGRSEQHWQQAQRDVLASVPAAPVAADQLEQVTLSEGPLCAPRETDVLPSDSVEVFAAAVPVNPVRPVVGARGLMRPSWRAA